MLFLFIRIREITKSNVRFLYKKVKQLNQNESRERLLNKKISFASR